MRNLSGRWQVSSSAGASPVKIDDFDFPSHLIIHTGTVYPAPGHPGPFTNFSFTGVLEEDEGQTAELAH